MTDTDRRIAEIRARHEAATPGEWKAEPLAGRGGWVGVGLNYTALSCGNTDREAQRNAHFIAHAHQDTPFLLTLVSEQSAQLAEGVRLVRALKGMCSQSTQWLELIDPVAHWADSLTTERADKAEGETKC